MLTVVLWPWSKNYREANGRINMERTALWTIIVCFIISALYGAVPGSYYGNGFHTFLAEDTIRLPIKTTLQLAVIGHLHIMVALVGAGVLLCVSRWTKFKDSGSKLYTWAMPLAILGALILSAGVWIIVLWQDIAHLIIYAGSAMLLPSGLIILIYVWMKIIRDRKAELGKKKIGFGRGFVSLLRSPFWFGATWMMLFMNFVVTFVGLFMAATLDEWRHHPLLMERITLSGHWHILSTIIAIMIMFIYAERIGLTGKIKHWFVWPVVIGSNVAFAAMAIYSMKHLFIEEAVWQPLINTLMILADIGLVLVLINLAALIIWRLVDLFKADGRWRKELDEASSLSEEVTPL